MYYFRFRKLCVPVLSRRGLFHALPRTVGLLHFNSSYSSANALAWPDHRRRDDHRVVVNAAANVLLSSLPEDLHHLARVRGELSPYIIRVTLQITNSHVMPCVTLTTNNKNLSTLFSLFWHFTNLRIPKKTVKNAFSPSRRKLWKKHVINFRKFKRGTLLDYSPLNKISGGFISSSFPEWHNSRGATERVLRNQRCSESVLGGALAVISRASIGHVAVGGRLGNFQKIAACGRRYSDQPGSR